MPEIIFGPVRKTTTRKTTGIKKANKHPNWGGRRPGSGRKPSGDKPLDAMVVVRMTDKQKAFYKMAGGSAWLRALLTACMEQHAKNEAEGKPADQIELLGGLKIEDILPESMKAAAKSAPEEPKDNTGF